MKLVLFVIFTMATTAMAQHRFDVSLHGKTTGDVFMMFGKAHNKTTNEQTDGERWIYYYSPITADSSKVHSVEYGFMNGNVFFQKVNVRWFEECSTGLIDSIEARLTSLYGTPKKRKKAKSKDMLIEWKVGKLSVIYFVSYSNDAGEPMLAYMFYDERKLKGKR